MRLSDMKFGRDPALASHALKSSPRLSRTIPQRSAITLGLLLGVLILMGCTRIAQLPPPAPLAPNASLITAQVQAMQYSQNVSTKRLNIEVLTSEPREPGLMSLVKPGDILWAFTTSSAITLELLGRTIQATVRLVGDERGQEFWVDEIQILGP